MLCCSLSNMSYWGQESLGSLYKPCQVTELPHLLFVSAPQLVWNCNNLPTKYSHSSPSAPASILPL